MAFIEVIFYALSLNIGVVKFKAVDVGGAIFIHSFGAYFGLTCSYFLTAKKKKAVGHPANNSGY